MECDKAKKGFSGFLENTLPQEAREKIITHLSSCNGCRYELKELEKTLSLLNTLDEVEPPAWLTRKVMAKIRKETAPEKGLWERFFGRASFSPPAAALATVAVAVIAFVAFKGIWPGAGRIMMPPSSATPAHAPSQEPKHDESKTLRNNKDAHSPKNASVPLAANKAREDVHLRSEEAGTIQPPLPAKSTSSEKIIAPTENMAASTANQLSGGALPKAKAMIQAQDQATVPPSVLAPQEMAAQAGPGLSSKPGALQDKSFKRKPARNVPAATNEEAMKEMGDLRRQVTGRYENGRPKAVVTYSIISGQEKKLMVERFDEYGLRHGLQEAYDHNGKVALAVEYRHGKVISVRELTAEGTYRNGPVSENWPWLKLH